MKHKVGDKVTIRNDLKTNNEYGGEIFIYDMNKYKGKTTEINEIYETPMKRILYSLEIDDKDCWWTDEMFEDKSKSTKKTIEHIISDNKTIVIIHNEDGSYKKGVALCSPEDKFDENVGFKLAYDRAIGIKNNKQHKEQINKELWKEFVKSSIAINCQTKEEARKFLNYCNLKGYKWWHGIEFESSWNDYKINTCYRTKGDCIDFCEISYYKDKGYNIIKYNQLFNLQEKELNKSLENIDDLDLLMEIQRRLCEGTYFKGLVNIL